MWFCNTNLRVFYNTEETKRKRKINSFFSPDLKIIISACHIFYSLMSYCPGFRIASVLAVWTAALSRLLAFLSNPLIVLLISTNTVFSWFHHCDHDLELVGIWHSNWEASKILFLCKQKVCYNASKVLESLNTIHKFKWSQNAHITDHFHLKPIS